MPPVCCICRTVLPENKTTNEVTAVEFFEEFPSLGRKTLSGMKQAVDETFKGFSRAYGEQLENFFDPLLRFLIWFEKLLEATPWPVILLVVGGLAWLGSR